MASIFDDPIYQKLYGNDLLEIKNQAQQLNKEQALAHAYANEKVKDNNLKAPNQYAQSTDGYNQIDYSNVVRDKAKRTAQQYNIQTKEQALSILSQDSLVMELYKDNPEAINALADSMVNRSQELYQTGAARTFDPNLDEPEQDTQSESLQQNAILTSNNKTYLGDLWDGIADMSSDIIGGIYNGVNTLLGTPQYMTQTGEDNYNLSNLAQQRSALGMDTKTGMDKLYTWRSLNETTEQLKHQLDITSDPYTKANLQNQLEIAESQLNAIQLSSAEEAAVRQYGATYDNLTKQIDNVYNRLHVDDNIMSESDYERKLAQSRRDFRHKYDGNSTLQHAAEDVWGFVTDGDTLSNLAYATGSMLPFAAEIALDISSGGSLTPTLAAQLGTTGLARLGAKALSATAKGVDAIANLTTKTPTIASATSKLASGAASLESLGAKAFAKTWVDLARANAGWAGKAQTIAGLGGLTAMGNASATQRMNDYFNQFGTTDGFDYMKAVYYSMAEQLLDVAGGEIVGKLIPEGISKKLFAKAMKNEIDTAIDAAKKAGAVGNPGAAAAGAMAWLDKILSKPGDFFDSLATSQRHSELARGATAGKINKWDVASLTSKAAHTVVHNKTGIDLATVTASGLSEAVDNVLSNTAGQLAAQTGIDPDEIYKAAIEGFATAGMASPGLTATAHIKNAVKKSLHTKNKFAETEEQRLQLDELIRTNNGSKEVNDEISARLSKIKDAQEESLRIGLDKTGEKIAKKFSNELVYNATKHTLEAKGTLSEEANKAYQKFNAYKDNYINKVTTAISERENELIAMQKRNVREYIKNQGADTDILGDKFLFSYLTNLTKGTKKEHEKIAEAGEVIKAALKARTGKDVSDEAVKDLTSFFDKMNTIDPNTLKTGEFDKKIKEELASSFLGDKEAAPVISALNKAGMNLIDLFTLKHGDTEQQNALNTFMNNMASVVEGSDLEALNNWNKTDYVKHLFKDNLDKNGHLTSGALQNLNELLRRVAPIDKNDIREQKDLAKQNGKKDYIGKEVEPDTDTLLNDLDSAYANGKDTIADAMFNAATQENGVFNAKELAGILEQNDDAKRADLENYLENKYKEYNEQFDTNLANYHTLRTAEGKIYNSEKDLLDDLKKAKLSDYYNAKQVGDKWIAEAKDNIATEQFKQLQENANLLGKAATISDLFKDPKTGDLVNKLLKEKEVQKAIRNTGIRRIAKYDKDGKKISSPWLKSTPINTVDDILTFNPMTQQLILEAILRHLANKSNQIEQAKTKAESRLSAKEKGVILSTHFKAGNLNNIMQNAYGATLQNLAEAQETAAKEAELAKQKEFEEMGLSKFREMSPKQMRNQLTQRLAHMGFFSYVDSENKTTLLDYLQDLLGDDPTNPKKGVDVVKALTNFFKKQIVISNKFKQQLNAIIQFLEPNIQKKNSDLAYITRTLKTLYTIFDSKDIPLDDETGVAFWEDVDTNESWLKDWINSGNVSRVVKQCSKFNTYISRSGVAELEQEKSWNEDLNLSRDSRIKDIHFDPKGINAWENKVTNDLKDSFNEYTLGGTFLDNATEHHLWDFLSMKHASGVVCIDLADIATDTNVVKFLRNGIDKSAKDWEASFKSLDRSAQLAVVDFLLRQPITLVQLGWLRAQDINPNLPEDTLNLVTELGDTVAAKDLHLWNAVNYHANKDNFLKKTLKKEEFDDFCKSRGKPVMSTNTKLFYADTFHKAHIINDQVFNAIMKEALFEKMRNDADQVKYRLANALFNMAFTKKQKEEYTPAENDKPEEKKKKEDKKKAKLKEYRNLFTALMNSDIFNDYVDSMQEGEVWRLPRAKDIDKLEQEIENIVNKLGITRIYGKTEKAEDGKTVIHKWNDENPTATAKAKKSAVKQLKKYILHNYGHLVYGKVWDQIGSEALKASEGTSDERAFVDRLTKAYGRRKAKIHSYNSHAPINVDVVGAESYDTLWNVLQENDVSKSTLQELVTGLSKDTVFDVLWENESIDNIAEEDIVIFTKAMAKLIEADESILNSNKRDEDDGLDITPLNPSQAGKNITHSKSNFGTHDDPAYFSEKDRRKSRNVFLYDNGIDTFEQANVAFPEIGKISDLLSLIENWAAYMQNALLVDTSKRIVDVIEGQGGSLNYAYVQTMVATALNYFPTLKPKTSDEFLDLMLTRYGPAVARTYATGEYCDATTTALEIGKDIARSMGISKDSYLFEQYAINAGRDALIALQEMGYLQHRYIRKSDGVVLPIEQAHGEALAGCIPVIEITDTNAKSRISNLTSYKYQDESNKTKSGNLLSKMLDSAHENVTHPYDNYDFIANQMELWNRFKDDGGNPDSLNLNAGDVVRDSDFTIIKLDSALENNYKKLIENTYEGNNNEELPDEIKNSAMYKGYFIYRGDTRKTDGEYIESKRLAELTAKTINGVHLNVGNVIATFGAFITYDKKSKNWKFNPGFDENDSYRIVELLQKHPELRALLHIDEGLVPAFDTMTGSLYEDGLKQAQEKFRAFCRDMNYVVDLLNNNGITEEHTAFDKSTTLHMHFNETNTVNNRLFVDSIIFNYREVPEYRCLYQTTADRTGKLLNIGTDRKFDKNGSTVKQVDLIAPIFNNLGLDYDKMNSEDDFINAWKKLVGDGTKDAQGKETGNDAFKHIVEVAKTGSFADVITAIKAYNNQDAETKKTLTYHAYNNKKEDFVDEFMEIKPTVECYMALRNLAKMANANQKSLHKLFKLNTAIEGYNTRIEVDGLTNGPSIKNLASWLQSSKTGESIFKLGAVGISAQFTNIIDTYSQGGILDTYLLSGFEGKEEVMRNQLTDIVSNTFRGGDDLDYFATLYGAKEENDAISTLEAIFSRNMLKKPVMVLNYGAGKATVILKLYKEFDIKASQLFRDYINDKDTSKLNAWLAAAIKSNGGNNLVFTDKEGRRVIVKQDGSCWIDGGAMTNTAGKAATIFDTDVLNNLIFRIEDNGLMYSTVNAHLETLYNSMANLLSKVAEPYNKNQEASETIAEVYNAIVSATIDSTFAKYPDINLINKFKLVKDITDEVLKEISAVLQINDQATLNTLKKDLTKDISFKITFMSQTKSGAFARGTYGITAKSSLGAGESPMMIHSFDSDIVHHIQDFFRREAEKEILTIHDAKIVDPEDLDLAKETNKQYFQEGTNQIITFQSRDRFLARALNALKTKKYDIPDELRQRLINKVSNKLQECTDSTRALALSHLVFLKEERAKNQKDRTHFNQYAFMDTTAYTPSDSELDTEIAKLTDVLNETNIINANTYQFLKKVDQYLKSKGYGNKNLYDNNNQFKVEAFNKATTKEDIVKTLLALNKDKELANIGSTQLLQNIEAVTIENETNSNILDILKFTDELAKNLNVSNPTTPFKDITQSVDTSNSYRNINAFCQFLTSFMNTNSKTQFLAINEGVYGLYKTLNRVFAKHRNLLVKNNNFTKFDALTILQDIVGGVTGTQLSNEDKLAFERLFGDLPSMNGNAYGLISDNIQEFDPNAKTTLVMYNDEFDYSGLYDKWLQDVNKERIGKGQKLDEEHPLKKKAQNFLIKQIQDELVEQLKGIQDDTQVVFTMRTKADILKLAVLDNLLRTSHRNRNIKIAIVPNMSNMSATPQVDREVALLQNIKQNMNANSKLHIMYNTTTHRSKNLSLLSVIANMDATESFVYNQTTTTTDPRIYLNNPGNTSADYVSRTDDKIRNDNFFIYSHDELGASKGILTKDDVINGKKAFTLLDISKNQSNRADINQYDYTGVEDIGRSEALIAKPETFNVNGNNIQEDYTDLRQSVRSDAYWKDTNDTELDGSKCLADIFIDSTKAIGINITSNGDIIGTIGSAMAEQMTLVRKAHTSLKAQLEKDYNDYMRDRISWEEYLRPRSINVDDGMGNTKTFVFTITQDASIFKGELYNVISQTTYRGQTYADGLFLDTPFYNMLNQEYRGNLGATSSWIKENRNEGALANKRVRIPIHMLNTSLLEITNTPKDLQARNARYLARLHPVLAGRGITGIYTLHNSKTAVSNLDSYVIPSNSGITYKGIYMQNVYVSDLPYIEKGYLAKGWGYVNNVVNNALKQHGIINRLFNVVGRSNQVTDEDRETITNPNQHFYTGHRRKVNSVHDLIEFQMNDQTSYRSALDQAFKDDEERGVDSSHLRSVADKLVNLVTDITLIYDTASNTIEDSMEEVIEIDNKKREFITLGRATGRYESQAEGLIHELCHVVFNQLPKNSRVYQQARQLYLKAKEYMTKDYSYFEDGDNFKNRRIIDAIFSDDTADNLSEFLVYAMTNKDFQDALANLGMKEDLASAAKVRAEGIFNRMVTSVLHFLRGTPNTTADTSDVITTVRDIFNVSFKECNAYWSEMQNTGFFTKPNLIARNYDLSPNKWSGHAEEDIRKLAQDKLGPLPPILNKLVDNFAKALQRFVGYNDPNALTAQLRNYYETGLEPEDLMARARNLLEEHVKIKEGFLNDLLSSFEASSKDQYQYLKIRMQGKYIIDTARERAVAAINNSVKEILKKVPTRVEKHLTDYFVRADVSCLFNSTMTAKEVKQLLTDSKARTKKIEELKKTLLQDKWGNFYINASKGLAQYLTTGFNPTGLGLRNAYEIISLAANGLAYKSVDINGEYTTAVDQLTTLYAVEYYNSKEPKIYQELSEDVLEKLSRLHLGIKEAEFNDVYQDSYQKFHIPKGQLHGGTLHGRYDIIPESELKAYKWNGYTSLGDAKLDPFYKKHSKDKWYIVQAKHKAPVPSVAGIAIMSDLFNGRGTSGLSYNHINRVDEEIDFKRTAEYQDLKLYVNGRITALNQENPKFLKDETDGNLVLNYNSLGDLTGANFELNPIKTDYYTGRNVKFSSVLGDIYGSVIERSNTPGFNQKVGEAMREVYDNAKDKENFIWLSEDSENEDHRELYDKLPFDVKEQFKNRYGNKGIPVRKKALNTVFGYKNISSNDTRKFVEEEMKKAKEVEKIDKSLSDYLRYAFYNKYTGLAETFVKWLASTGKENLVIKGLNVSKNNLISNIITLGLHGLTPKESVQYQVECLDQMKVVRDINNQLMIIQSNKVMGNYTNEDASKERALKQHLHSLEIYPLIKAGALANTIAEDLTETDRFLKDFIDKYIPKGLGNTIVHNLALTPKAYLYQLLSDFAAFGDITAKYALYKHNVLRNISHEEAIRLSQSNFIDYTNPMPKSIQYMDDLGILPFMKYSLGIQSALLNTIGKNPNSALGWIFANAMFLNMPDIFGSFLGTGLLDKINLPGELMYDSIFQLPSVRISSTIREHLL